MSKWLPTILNGLALLGGIVLTYSFFLYSQFYRESRGYMWRAVRKIWPFLLMFFMLVWIIGAFFFYLNLGLPRYASVPVLLLAGMIGVMVAAIPTILESIFLPKSSTTTETLGNPITRLILKLNLILRLNYAWAIECCKQEDVYDCEEPNGGDLNVDPVLVRRRIRKLYEVCKDTIAKERNDPTFRRYDTGRTVQDKYYLLTRHVGRKGLRNYIQHPNPLHFPDWDGRERRKTVGTKADRKSDPDSSAHRSYDS